MENLLIHHVDYRSAMSLLGCQLSVLSLPATTRCPVCLADGQLIVAQDTDRQGCWTYCRKCEFAADIITLASRVWKLGIPETIARLQAHEAIPSACCDQAAVKSYIDNVRKQQCVQRFWEICRTNYREAVDESLWQLQQQFDAYADVIQQSRITAFMGASDRIAVQLFARISGLCNPPTISGAAWRTAPRLIIPYWNTPGRIAGFVLGSHGQSQPIQYAYWSLYRWRTEAGLIGMPALLQGWHPQYKDDKFIFTDVQTVLRLHSRSFRERIRPLPMASIFLPATQHVAVWRWFNPANLIFCGDDKITTIRQAIAANGRVADVPTTIASISKPSSTDWLLSHLQRHAVPWQIALRRYLRTIDSETVVTLLRDLHVRPEDFGNVVPADRITAITKAFSNIQPTHRSTVQLGSRIITEEPGGWYCKGVCVTDAIVRVEYVIQAAAKTYYRGHILYQSCSYPFLVSAATVQYRGWFHWLVPFVRDVCQAGTPVTSGLWSRRILQIATQFQTPQQVTASTVIGWDNEQQQFNFPTFTLRNGDIVPDGVCLLEKTHIPASQLELPVIFSNDDVQAVTQDTAANCDRWVLLCHVLRRLLRAAVNKNQPNLAINPLNAQTGWSTFLKDIGCCTWSLPNLAISKLQTQRLRHSNGWPTLITTSNVIDNRQFVLQHNDHNLVTAVTDNLQFAMMQLCRTIETVTTGNLHGETTPVSFSRVIPHLLQYITKPENWQHCNKDIDTSVFPAAERWLQSLQVDPTVVQRARQVTQLESEMPRQLVAVVYELCRTGRSIGVYGLPTPDDCLAIEAPDMNLVWISQTCLRAACHAYGYTLEISAVTSHLTAAGLIQNTAEPQWPAAGWVVPYTWWREQFATITR